MDVYHGEFDVGIWLKEFFMNGVIETVERAEEFDCGSREVHYEMRNCLRDCDNCRFRNRCRGCSVPGQLFRDGDGVVLGCG